MTVHNEARKEDIAKKVIMSGDPIRVEMIAMKYLDNPIKVNNVRNMYAYTGTYKGVKLTIMAHGMGMPSIGIYAYELFKFYDVDEIIRLGTCGSYDDNLDLLDIILVKNSYTESNFAYTLNNERINIISSNEEINRKIKEESNILNIKITEGDISSCDCFDWYMTDLNKYLERVPKNIHLLGAEMESFALFYLAHMFHKKASCLLTVVDSHTKSKDLTDMERQNGIDKMNTLALESIIKK